MPATSPYVALTADMPMDVRSSSPPRNSVAVACMAALVSVSMVAGSLIGFYMSSPENTAALWSLAPASIRPATPAASYRVAPSHVAARSPAAAYSVDMAPSKATRSSLRGQPLYSTTATDFDLTQYITTKAKAVEVALGKAVPDGLDPHPKVIFDAMRHSLLAGGKRLRPALVIAACEMVGGTEAMAMPTACALEMIHTMSLIHDDLPSMDNDDFRRGKPTCHKAFGEDIAILAGDALLAQSFALIAKETKGVPADRVLKVIGNLGTLSGAEGLVGGQVMDMQSEGLGGNVQLETLEYIHAHKTGALLEAAVVNGACMGGADDAELEVLKRFAQKIGLAFQIIDDVLDATMSGEQLGKTAGKDEAVSKATYVKLMGLEKSREMADTLIREGKAELDHYGDKAIPLLALADFITSRQN